MISSDIKSKVLRMWQGNHLGRLSAKENDTMEKES